MDYEPKAKRNANRTEWGCLAPGVILLAAGFVLSLPELQSGPLEGSSVWLLCAVLGFPVLLLGGVCVWISSRPRK